MRRLHASTCSSTENLLKSKIMLHQRAALTNYLELSSQTRRRQWQTLWRWTSLALHRYSRRRCRKNVQNTLKTNGKKLANNSLSGQTCNRNELKQIKSSASWKRVRRRARFISQTLWTTVVTKWPLKNQLNSGKTNYKAASRLMT